MVIQTYKHNGARNEARSDECVGFVISLLDFFKLKGITHFFSKI